MGSRDIDFFGDGICHNFTPGCYNHHICNYDGGDCCKDTCHGNTFSTCGSGYGVLCYIRLSITIFLLTFVLYFIGL